ncbi:hypothetical protein [Dokdonia sinensis]|uniref:hypothetical protein n=1 Tax=Dokdonia sinensis TaxID=2479847 RepID=UPI001374D1DE|nr:hypothetical protein [Dokdonia sinensis]
MIISDLGEFNNLAPSTQHPAPSTQHPAPSTQHPAPNTQHPALHEQGENFIVYLW